MKVKAIIFVAVVLAIIIAIHIVLFGPLASDYKTVIEKTSRDLPVYKQIVGQYDPERVVRITREMQEKPVNTGNRHHDSI